MSWTNTFRPRRCSVRLKRPSIGAATATFSPMILKPTGSLCISRLNPVVLPGDTDRRASQAGFQRAAGASGLVLPGPATAVARSARLAGGIGILLRPLVAGALLGRPGQFSS